MLSTVQRPYSILYSFLCKKETHRSLLKLPSIATSERSNDEPSPWDNIFIMDMEVYECAHACCVLSLKKAIVFADNNHNHSFN